MLVDISGYECRIQIKGQGLNIIITKKVLDKVDLKYLSRNYSKSTAFILHLCK